MEVRMCIGVTGVIDPLTAWGEEVSVELRGGERNKR